MELRDEIVEQVEILLKYEGYVDKESAFVDKMNKLEAVYFPSMTLLIGLSYGVLEKPGFDPNRADDLIPAINDALAASPQFMGLAAAERQDMYDSMLLSTAVIATVHQSDKVASKAIAKQTLLQLGLPSE